MITIENRESKKVSGESSLFIKFNYDADIVSVIKEIGGSIYHKKEIEWESPIFNFNKLINTLSLYDDVKFIDKYHEDTHEDIKYDLVGKLKTSPYPYQLNGIEYGLNHKNWLLLDSPGLGKSLQIIGLAEELKCRENINHCLIVCGINTLKNNWIKEIEKHSYLSAKVLGQKIRKNGARFIGTIADRVADIKSCPEEFFWVTNVETLRSNDVINALNANNIDMVVFDEIHTIKNPTSQQGKNALKLKNNKYKIGLTGTLLLNNPLECYVPLRWIGKEKSNFSTFKSEYLSYGGLFGNEIIGYKNIDFLKRTINKYSLRRTKDILDLPEKTRINEYIDLSDAHYKFYSDVQDGVVKDVDKVNINTASVLSMLTRLRQAIACPSILTTENIESTKINRCVELCDDIVSNGDKVVIFSTFKDTVNVLFDKLRVYNPLLITGDINDEIISDAIEKFQTDDNYKICVCTWQKAGTGITLNKARYAIFIDCSYTPALNEQAEDRIHRIGTKEPVFIYYLWANDTVDMRIKDILDDKSMINEFVLDNKCTPLLLQRLKNIITDLC